MLKLGRKICWVFKELQGRSLEGLSSTYVRGKAGGMRSESTGDSMETKAKHTECKHCLVDQHGMGWRGQSEQNPDILN